MADDTEGLKAHLEKTVGVVQATKFDGGKIRPDLFPIRAKTAIDGVFTFGSIKYDVGNWFAGNGFEWSRLIASLERHLVDFKAGIDYDPESKLPVLAHLGCCNAMLLEHFLTQHGIDDRKRAQMFGASINPIDLTMPAESLKIAQEARAKRLGGST